MGYEVFVFKFEDGDASQIEEYELEEILSKYGAIEESEFGTEFISNVGEVCEYALILKNKTGEIFGISFNRPTTNHSLPKIVFDLLGIKNTCFFGPDLEFMLSRNELGDHIPKGLLEHFPDGPQIVSQPGESWPWPLLQNLALGEYSPTIGSPAVDARVDYGIGSSEMDFLGNNRLINYTAGPVALPDMGAIELQN